MANNELSLSSLGIQLPYNMQAEQSVLGAALMDETILNRLITEMDPDMFYSEQNRAVYEEMRRLFSESEAVDVITLVDSLAQNGVFKGADDAKVYITRIAETVPAISNVDSYIKIVKEKYQTRRLIEAARDIRALRALRAVARHEEERVRQSRAHARALRPVRRADHGAHAAVTGSAHCSPAPFVHKRGHMQVNGFPIHNDILKLAA